MCLRLLENDNLQSIQQTCKDTDFNNKAVRGAAVGKNHEGVSALGLKSWSFKSDGLRDVVSLLRALVSSSVK